MKLIRWLLLLLIWMFPAWCFAAEENSADNLVVQAEIPRYGDFLGFGFGSLWMMSGGRLARVDTADNSVVDIEIEGTTLAAIQRGSLRPQNVEFSLRRLLAFRRLLPEYLLKG